MKTPDWNFWQHMPIVEPWQACALALNIDPDSVIPTTDGMGALGSGKVTYRGLADERFYKLLQLLNANQFEKQHFKQNFAMGVRLSEFAAWCAPVVRGLGGSDIPKELAAMAKDAPQSAPAATVEAGPVAIPSGDDAEEQVPSDVDHDEALAALFDPVTVEALEKMFSSGDKWKSWAERATRVGLCVAREGRGKFNPYKAAIWFLSKGIAGWDLARCYRVLANNLPARSKDNEYLLTGSID